MGSENIRKFSSAGFTFAEAVTAPGAFPSWGLSMGEGWIQPLWSLVSDSRLAYQPLIEVIKGDVGAEELVLNTSVAIPLPLPTAAQGPLCPAYEPIAHIKRTEDLARTIIDITDALQQVEPKDVRFAALSPDHLLFQKNPLSGRSVGARDGHGYRVNPRGQWNESHYSSQATP
ncbi:hypothetical protein B0H15DRAFT_796613 [Mycena belliarum]|uniref:Uncharacterized protein n=1 Tax=Mycena belliarum TaxID=1033014 RepID=A0AAD6UH24_9AGAR|nr:hypothetical protein B0H15DRAFT_796613 [Mycena belliae]